MAAKKKPQLQKMKIRPHASIGAAAAEDDEKYLSECFIDTGDAAVANDVTDSKCILLGRTGSGKSALIINMTENHDHVININPNSLALSYISNSNILNFFESLGIDLDIFYQLLWRHVLCVELLNCYFDMKNDGGFRKFRDWLGVATGRNKNTQIAINYLEKWDTKFWSEREEKIKEITKTMENQLTGAVGADMAGINFDAGYLDKISTNTKSEIVNHAQKVVNEIQIRDLGEVIKLLSDELFNDEKRQFYIVIDKLDEKWVDSISRCKLIRALIEAIKSFRKIRSLKIIAALRSDLLDQVYRVTADYGFQPEKYEDLNLRIRWSQEKLRILIEERISIMLQWEYSGSKKIGFFDIFPEKIGGKDSISYILQRTLLRPRDAIAFINTILRFAEGKDHISEKIVRDAEGVYSDQRKDALLREWISEYPNLDIVMNLFQQRGSRFSFSDFGDKDIEEAIISLCSSHDNGNLDELSSVAYEVLNGKKNNEDLLIIAVIIAYKVGIIGIKPSDYSKIEYCFDTHATITQSQIYPQTEIYIHPMLWRSFGIHKRRENSRK